MENKLSICIVLVFTFSVINTCLSQSCEYDDNSSGLKAVFMVSKY